jgi:hypothetical protein
MSLSWMIDFFISEPTAWPAIIKTDILAMYRQTSDIQKYYKGVYLSAQN